MAGLRAAVYGVPFMPVRGFAGSALKESLNLKEATCPYSGEKVLSAPVLKPDIALIHVQEADVYGNCRIFGTLSHDELASRAAKKVVVSAERVVDSKVFQDEPELTTIPHFLVEAVVEAPRGAFPGSCFPFYSISSEGVRDYLESLNDPVKLQDYLIRVR